MRNSGLTGLLVLRIDDSRFTVALEFFREGKTLQFEDTRFVIDFERDRLEVMRLVESGDLDALQSTNEIARAQDVYEYLCSNSPGFAEIVGKYTARFSVVCDYWTGSVMVCYLRDNKLVWKT
jgi:hypothetical protein